MRTTPYGWWRQPAVNRRAVDLAIVLVCLGLTVLAVKGVWAPLPRSVIAVAGTIGSLAQYRRRRWPHAAALAGSAAFALSGNVGPWLVGLAAVAFYAPRRQAWLSGLVALAGFLAWAWIDDGRPDVQVLLAGALGVALVLVASSYLATREALLAALRAQAAHAAAEQELRDERARAAERTRIAREMHDVLAHKVSLIALHAGALELRAGDDQRLREGTGLIRTTARQALQELREVLGILRVGADGREASTDLSGLVEASTAAGQAVELRDDAGSLPPGTARVVYRIVQEGLTNAHKHAPGARTMVRVSRDDEEGVTVTVVNGTSVSQPAELPGAGSGLIGLAERIRLVGGTLRSGPSTEDGARVWRLRATVPWMGDAS